MLTGKKILITGASGQTARPVAEALASGNEVWCLGRFADAATERRLLAHGVKTCYWDMARDSLSSVPDNFSHVLHAAVDRGVDAGYDAAIEINSVAVGRLMNHCRQLEAFLFVSTGGVYKRQNPDRLYREDDPLDGASDILPAYPAAKLAAEGVVRAFAVTHGIPATIARLNVSYGPASYGGVPMLYFGKMLNGEPIPVPVDSDDWTSMIHSDDIVRQVPLLWEVASTPATVVNWGGDDKVGLAECCRYMSGLTGVGVTFCPGGSRETCAFDNTKRTALIGPCEVGWRDGLRRTLQSHFPDIVK
ncbi:NAD-dependent epimerase/dehydratase family protein [Kibdelosporangium aridum]|uniref:NAD-dependent epimerase/dehydratase family protein n=1 Tax=Kibdelosporangium aridum TaxID=2030 RepID=UPI000526AF37